MSFRLPRLPSAAKIVNAQGMPAQAFMLYWQRLCERIEAALNSLADAIAAIQAAQDAADAANAAAANANNAAASAAREQALVNSFIDPESVVTATPTDVAIAGHDRVYSDEDNTRRAVAAATVPHAYAAGTVVYVSYTDPARAGGAVTYILSTTAPVQTGDTHVVEAVTIPAAGSQIGGGGPTRPGYVEP